MNILDKPINEIYRIAVLHHLGASNGNKVWASKTLGVCVRAMTNIVKRFKITKVEIDQAIAQAKLEGRLKTIAKRNRKRKNPKPLKQITPTKKPPISERQKAIDCLVKSKGNIEVASRLYGCKQMEFVTILWVNKIPF